MDEKTRTKQRGIKMAMQVAAISLGVGGAVAAVAAEAQAEPGATNAASPLDQAVGTDGSQKIQAPEPMKVTGWSCWGPVSRGPLAPPPQDKTDFDALVAELSS